MHFSFNPGGVRPGGLRLIDEIPDFAICHLEGRNGAGKSLALRLLEMVSGEQPYQATPSAWSSLRTNLADTTVTVEGVDGATLRVNLLPERWPSEPEPIGEWLGEAFLADEAVPIVSIASRLRVIRIAGDETFENTIKRRLSAEAARINRAHRRFELQQLELDELLARLDSAMAAVPSDQSGQKRLTELQKEIPAAEHDLRASQDHLSLLTEALIAQQRLYDRESQLPAILEQLSAVEQAAKALQKKLSLARRRQAEVLAEMALGSGVKEEIRKVRSLREGRLRRLQQRATDVERLATQLNLPATSEVISREFRNLTDERRQNQSDLASASHNASVRTLASRLAYDLGQRRELDNEVVAVLTFMPELPRISVSQLRAGVQQRQVELAVVEDDPLLLDLRKNVERLSKRLTTLSALLEAIGAQERAKALLHESDDHLAALLPRANATNQVSEEYAKINSHIAVIEHALHEKHAEEARLRVQADQLRGSQSADELTERIELAVQSLHIDPHSALDEHRQRLAASVDQQRTRLQNLRSSELELQESLAVARVHIAEAARLLVDFSWLPAKIKLALARTDDQDAADAVHSLRAAIASVRDSLYLVRTRFDHLQHAAKTLTEEVGRHGKGASATTLLEELAEEMSERLRNEFDQSEIRLALFDDGQLEAINLRTLEAQWITKDRSRRSRPFEAFSSGEQAFAYTLARIERVTAIDAKHKVIALDEFGAFLARDRLERLVRFLREMVVGQVADQAIIVVPLAANYQEQAEMTTGDLHERFVRRARELESRRYFTEDASYRELV